MANLCRHRVLIAGVLSPIAAIGVVVAISFCIEHWGRHFPGLESAYLPIIFIFTALPFLTTLLLASSEYRRRTLTLWGKMGVGVAAVSLVCPIWAGYAQFFLWRATWNLKQHDVSAPVFSTLDVDGVNRSLNDQKGRVVLVNVWATWCHYCLAEMPELDRLYREHKDEGLVVFGLSDEDAAIQKKCLEKRPVSYPLLTYKGQIPGLYRHVALYPTTFLIDREGKLQRGIAGEKDPGEIERVTVALLRSTPHGNIP